MRHSAGLRAVGRRRGPVHAGRDYLVARDGEEMTRAPARAARATPAAPRRSAAHGRRTVLARHTCAHRVDELLGIVAQLRRAVPRTAPSRRAREPAGMSDRVLRLEPRLGLLERRGHLLPRHRARRSHERGHRVTFYEPDAYDRQAAPRHRRPGLGARRGLRGRARGRARSRRSRRRAGADLVVKASGVGVFDDAARDARSSSCSGPARSVALLGRRRAGDARPGRAPTRRDPFARARAPLRPGADLRRRRPRGARLPGARARAIACPSTTRSTRRRTSRSRPTRASRRTSPSSATACRTARRASRSSSCAPRSSPRASSFLLGGAGWGDRALPAQRALRGPRLHARPQRLQRHAAAVLNVSRDSMAALRLLAGDPRLRGGRAPAPASSPTPGRASSCSSSPAREVLVARGRRGGRRARARADARARRARSAGAALRRVLARAHLRPPRGAGRGACSKAGARRQRRARDRAGALPEAPETPLRIVILGLSITSSWGNGHATTYRGLVRELAARGHDVLFLERDLPWYAENRDLPEPPYGRTRLYRSLRGAAVALRRGGAPGRPGDRRARTCPRGSRSGEWVTAHAPAARPPSTTSTRR